MRRIGFGGCFEHRKPRRKSPAAPWRERIDDAPAGQSVPGGMVAQHGTIAVERADRLIEIDLDQTRRTGGNRTTIEHGDAADDISGAEMEMDGQAIAQRCLGET